MLVIGLYVRIILILGAIVLSLSICLVIHRYFSLRRTVLQKRAYDRLQPLVLEFAFDELATINRLRAGLVSESDFRILKEILINFVTQIKGAAKDRLVYAYKALGFLESDIRDINSRKWWLQGRAANAIGVMRILEAGPHLTALIDSPHLEVRLMTACALGRLEDVRAVRVLLQEAAQSSRWIRIRLFELVENMREKALSELRKTLTEAERCDILSLCIEILGHAKDMDAAPLIMPFCDHPDVEVKTKAVKALGEIRYLPALEVLVGLLDDERWEVRALCSKALAGLEDVRVVDNLAQKLTDSHWWVRYNAAVGLSQIGEVGVDKLVDISNNSADRFARDIAGQALEELAFSG